MRVLFSLSIHQNFQYFCFVSFKFGMGKDGRLDVGFIHFQITVSSSIIGANNTLLGKGKPTSTGKDYQYPYWEYPCKCAAISWISSSSWLSMYRGKLRLYSLPSISWMGTIRLYLGSSSCLLNTSTILCMSCAQGFFHPS